MARRSHFGSIEMKVLCAWCCHEGQPGYMGEREPFEDPLPTHGICDHHRDQVLQSLPSGSFPGAEILIVVRQDCPALYERLRWSFAAMSRVAVVLDRRVSERREASRQRSKGRRHVRTRRIREGTPSSLGDFTIFRLTPDAPPTPAFDDFTEPVDPAHIPEHIALIAETAVMMTRPPTAEWFARPPSPRTRTAR